MAGFSVSERAAKLKEALRQQLKRPVPPGMLAYLRVVETSARSAGLPRWLMRLELTPQSGGNR